MTATLTELEGPAGPRLERWAKRILTASCMLLLSAGLLGLVLVGDGNEPVPATKELARLQGFVTEAKTAHFTADNHQVDSSGQDGVGTDYSSRSKVEGVIELPGRSQWTEDDGDLAYETIVTPTGSYHREADDRAALADELWIYEARPAGAPDTDTVDPSLMSAVAVSQSFDAPELVDLLHAARQPVRVDEHVIRVDVDVTKLPGYDADNFKDPDTGKTAPLPDVSIELTTGDAGQLDRMVIRVKENLTNAMLGLDDGESGPSSMTFTSDVHFTKWGEPATFVIPSADAVDPTPGVDEADIASFAAFPLYGLRRLPAGFELTDAFVSTTPEDASPDDGDCAEVDLSYANVAEQQAAEAKAAASGDWDTMEYPPTLDVSLTPADCDYYDAIGPGDGDPITLGRAHGLIYRGTDLEDEYRTSLEVIVGTTRVRIDSDLPEAQTLAAASDIVAFDLGTQPVHHEAPPPAA